MIVHGNEEVLRARFADALYFYRQDLQKPLAEFVPALGQLTFLEGLARCRTRPGGWKPRAGSAPSCSASMLNEAHLTRAAHLAKADLATGLVKRADRASGRDGAASTRRSSGEAEAVATAIAEHYLPRSAGDALPRRPIGMALAVADRVDTLVAAFAAGLEPTGSSDPYGLRRAGLGLLTILVSGERRLAVDALIDLAAQTRRRSPLTDERRAALQDVPGAAPAHLAGRAGRMKEVVESVLAVQADRPGLAAATVERAGDGALVERASSA